MQFLLLLLLSTYYVHMKFYDRPVLPHKLSKLFYRGCTRTRTVISWWGRRLCARTRGWKSGWWKCFGSLTTREKINSLVIRRVNKVC